MRGEKRPRVRLPHLSRIAGEEKRRLCLELFKIYLCATATWKNKRFCSGNGDARAASDPTERRGLSNARRFLRVKMTRSTKFEAPCV